MQTQISIYRARPEHSVFHDEAAQRSHSVLAGQPGFIGRILGRNQHDPAQYVEAIQWASGEHARAAFAAAEGATDVRAWLGHVDLASVKMYRMRTQGVVSRAESALFDTAVGIWLLVRWHINSGVDPVAHLRNELVMQHELFAPVAGYLGAHVLREVDGPEWMSLIAWSNLDAAQRGVDTILGDGGELVAHHMADCAAGASLHYVEPILRA